MRARIPLLLFAAALVVRLVFNLTTGHVDDLQSDPATYVLNAKRLWEAPLDPQPQLGLWPPGTSMLVALLLGPTGGDFRAVAVAWAVLGAASAVLGFDVARRVSHHRWVPPVVAAIGIGHYLLILQGSYIMSEPPFTFFLMLQLWLAVRFVQDGDRRDAVGFGAVTALAAAFRPQILLSFVFTGLVAPKRRQLAVALAPLVLGLGLLSGYLFYNTRIPGLVSHNEGVNLVFGRCHNVEVVWDIPQGRGAFRAHAMLSLFRAARAGASGPLRLAPAMGKVIELEGRIMDRRETLGIVAECVERTGFWRQLRYSATHVLLSWHIAGPFPAPESHRGLVRGFMRADALLFEIPSLLGLAWLFSRRRPAMRVVAANYLALLVTVAVYFGEVRMRLPYQYIVALLSFELVGDAIAWIRGRRS